MRNAGRIITYSGVGVVVISIITGAILLNNENSYYKILGYFDIVIIGTVGWVLQQLTFLYGRSEVAE